MFIFLLTIINEKFILINVIVSITQNHIQVKENNHMKVKTIADAWRKANEIFPTDYMKDDTLSKKAGYPQYYSTSPEHSADHINDLNVRLEVCVGDQCTNIWIEEMEAEAPQKVQMSQRLYRDIYMLISGQADKAEREMETHLEALDAIDHLDPANGIELKNVVDRIKDCRERKHHFDAMLEQFEKEVDA